MPRMLPVVAGILLILLVVMIAVMLRRHIRRTQETVREWYHRERVADETFLRACDIPDDPFRAKVALAARRIIAELGTVPPQTILAEDSMLEDLGRLPFWDSPDWLELVMRLEAELEVEIPDSAVGEVYPPAAGESQVQIRHVIHALSLGARPYLHRYRR